MRILLTADPEIPVPPTEYGGIERIVDLLVIELQIRGHDVGLVAHRDSTSPAETFFPWPGTRSQHPWDTARNLPALWAAVRRFQPDILHSFSRALYLSPLLPTGLRKVMSYQRKPGSRQVAAAAKLANGSLVFTGCSEHICREGRAGGGNWRAIHNFVHLEKYPFREAVASDAPLVFLSRVERIKGAHRAIDIAVRTGRRLLIAGNYAESGEERRYWNSEIAPHIGTNGVEYVGTVNDRQKAELLGSAAALVVPIEWDEPFGIVFAESLACGTPVISCPRGALPEIVRQGIDGFLVGTVQQGCDAVEQIATISRAACRARAEAMFSAPVAVAQYESLYETWQSN